MMNGKSKSQAGQHTQTEQLTDWHQRCKPRYEELLQMAHQVHAMQEPKSEGSKHSMRLLEQAGKLKEDFLAKGPHIQEIDRYLQQQQQQIAGLQSDLKLAREGIASLQQELRTHKERVQSVESLLQTEREKSHETEQRMQTQQVILETEYKAQLEEAEKKLTRSKANQQVQTDKAVFHHTLLDFTKYEEIITYIQTWAEKLEEPSAILNPNKEIRNENRLNLSSVLDNHSPEAEYLVLDVDTCMQEIRACSQDCLDSVFCTLDNKVSHLVKFLISSRITLLSAEFGAHKSHLEAMQKYIHEDLWTMAPRESVELMLKALEAHCAGLKERILILTQWLKQ